MKTTLQRYKSGLSLHINLFLLTLASVLLTLGDCWCFDTEITQFSGIASIDFSYDNQTLLALDKTNKKINIWRLDTKQLIKVYPTTDNPTAAKFSKTGNYFAYGTTLRDIIIVQTINYGVVRNVSNPTNQPIVDLDFSWNSNNIAVCSSSKFKFIDFTGAGTWAINGLGNMQSCKLNKADGLGVAHDNNWIEWFLKDQNNANNAIAKDQITDCDFVFQVDFSLELLANQPRLLGTCKKGGKHSIVSLYYGDINKNRLVRNISNEGKAICYSRDNKYFAAGDLSGKFYVLAADGWINDTYQIFQDSPNSIEHCRFSHDGKYLAAGDILGNIYIYTNDCFPKMCAQGQYDNAGVCASCSVMAYCIDCTSGTTCIACSPNYYLDTGSCRSCRAISYCISCESASICKQCQQGYYLNSTSCVSCDTHIKGCLSCSSNQTNQTCLNCHSQYYLNTTDGICYPCIINGSSCVNCLGPDVCLSCAPSYYLSNYSCVKCQSNCRTCSNSSICLQCNKGFYTNQTSSYTCKQCNSNCLDCYNDGTCINCIQGFYSKNGTCSNCSYPCQTCNTNNSCYSCYTGYFIDSNFTCTACRAGCLNCRTSQFCLTCQIGYQLLWNNTCSLCTKNFTKCISCNQTQCLGCEQGYFLTFSKICTSCNMLEGCQNCLNSTVCTICNIGYYLKNSACSPCNSFCQSCYNSTFCLNCAVGYYLSSNTCNPCSIDCISCTSNTDCERCIIGYYLNSTTAPRGCLKCNLAIAGCSSCNSSSNCLQCEVGRYVTALGVCSYCISNCSICNMTACISCNVGFYIDSSGFCIKCSENCSQCSSLTICSSCKNGLYLNTSAATSNCYSCASRGCLTCNMAGCLSCHLGNYLSSLTCISCNISYSNCYICKQSGCLQCNYGFFINSSGSCVSCITNITGCTSCFNSSTCSDCSKGYYLTPASICIVCPIQCLSCSNNICTSCRNSYIFDSTNTSCILCEKFLQGCQLCSSNSTCYDCLQGYYLSNSICLNCKKNILACLSCFNSTYCSVCQQGYYSLNGICQSCNSIPTCSFCSNSTNCVSCQSGYYLNNLGSCSICTNSLPGCHTCLNQTTCRQCQSGFYLDLATVQCISCLSGQKACLRCSNSSSCIQCDGGYYLNNSTLTCLPCNQTGCQICHNNLINSCTSCTLGYFLSGTQCLKCSLLGCYQCNSTNCLKCATGYYSSGNSCTSCKAMLLGCNKCVNQSICSQCDSSFYLTNIFTCSSCENAIPSCQICFNSTQCITCKSGYYPLSSGSCASCKNIDGCFMCTNSSYCQSCYKGYYINSNICLTCSSVISNCYQCNNSSTCFSCTSGFLLDSSGKCIQIVVQSRSIYDPIPFLQVKTYYIFSNKLKHVFEAKQGYQFSKSTVNWNSTTVISLFNTALNAPTKLTIISVQYGPRMKSIIFYTNNPLNLSRKQIQMPFMRLLLKQQDFSFSYQTKFQMSKEALSILFPNVVFANGFSQNKPLMQPSFYISFIEQAGQYHYTIIGYVIVGFLALNMLIKTICTAPSSQNLGDHIPHILALKTCSLLVYPIYVQVSNLCYGLMAADIPWLSNLYSNLYLSDPSDVSPIGYQLFYDNMNFASMYLSGAILFILISIIGLLTCNKTKNNKGTQIFSLPSQQNQQNKSSANFIKVMLVFFSFGLTFAGSSSIQGALFNPIDQLQLNGLFYIIGAIVYIIMLVVTIKLTYSQKKSVYLRSFTKASILSISHISPIYLCSLSVAIDITILITIFKKFNGNIYSPKLWFMNGIICNIALLLLFYYGQNKLILYIVVSLVFISVLIQFYQHYQESKIESKIMSSDSGTSQKNIGKQQFEKNNTLSHLNNYPMEDTDIKPFDDFKSSLNFQNTLYIKESENYQNRKVQIQRGQILNNEKKESEKKSNPQRRLRKFNAESNIKKYLRIQPVTQNNSDFLFEYQQSQI